MMGSNNSSLQVFEILQTLVTTVGIRICATVCPTTDASIDATVGAIIGAIPSTTINVTTCTFTDATIPYHQCLHTVVLGIRLRR